jgi:hypothetical protein
MSVIVVNRSGSRSTMRVRMSMWPDYFVERRTKERGNKRKLEIKIFKQITKRDIIQRVTRTYPS